MKVVCNSRAMPQFSDDTKLETFEFGKSFEIQSRLRLLFKPINTVGLGRLGVPMLTTRQ